MKNDDPPMNRRLSAESLLVAAGRDSRPGAPLNRPIVPASNFILGTERAYARASATPTWEALEEIVGQLEEGHTIAFSSGMAGIAAVFDQLPVGSKVVIPDDCYQGVVEIAEFGRQKGIWDFDRLPLDDTPAWVRACADADLIWLESPSNPLLTVADVAAICAAPRKPTSLLAVDNTFATALNLRPLDLGADISFQSATKFIGGHSDLLAGVVTVKREDLRQALHHSRTLHGASPGALECYLAARGARTMALRLERAQANAMILAERLSAHPRVVLTRYPGLSSHPTHGLARAQLRGFGTIISFDVEGGAAQADAVCAHLELIHHATSLGAVESTIERRAAVPGQQHLPPSLLRLSVGIENVEELWADLEAALGAPGKLQTPTLDDLVADLRALGVSEGDIIMPHVSLRRVGLAGEPQGAERLLEALDIAVGPTGTLLAILGTESPHEYVNTLSEDERAATLANETPFVLAEAPALAEVGAFAEVFRRAHGTIQSANPSGRFGARGARAAELVDGQPVDDYYGPKSPLERLVEGGGKVVRIGSDPESTTLLHYAEYLANIEDKRRVRWDYLLATPEGPRHVITRCLDDMNGIVHWDGDDYFKLAIEAYDATGHGRHGRIGHARAALYDATHLAQSTARWMERELGHIST